MAGVPYNYNPLAARLFPQERTFWDKLADYGKDKAQSAFETLWGAVDTFDKVRTGELYPQGVNQATGQTVMLPEVSDAAQLVAELGLGGGLPTAGMRVGAGIFGGKLAKTADLKKLEQAKTLDAEGAYPATIWDQTGWFKGADGEWRFEIDDSASRFDKQPLLDQRNRAVVDPLSHSSSLPVSSSLEHKPLYAAYPDLAEIDTVILKNAGGNKGTYQAPIDPGDRDFIGLQHRPQQDMHSTLLHELQHAIQQREGFAMGGNAFALKPNTPAWDIYQDIKKKMLTPLSLEEYAQKAGFDGDVDAARDSWLEYKRDLKDGAALYDVEAQKTAVQEAYRRAAGEVEARNVQHRMLWPDEDRRKIPPYFTQDTSVSQQIIRKR